MEFITAKELSESRPEPVEWVCKPWLAREAITVLDGAPKSAGKTTFALAMCAAILKGEEFLDEPTTKTAIVYLTEESRTSFMAALRRAGIADASDFHVLLWRETHQVHDQGSEHSAWEQVMDDAVRYAKQVGAKLLVVDTFAQFAKLTGDKENSAGEVLKAMRPLQKARDEDLAVLVNRHDRKGGGSVGESGRGSSALSGAVDIILQLKSPEGRPTDTHRKIDSLSRFDETPSQMTIALTEDGYQVLGEAGAVAVPVAMKQILACLPHDGADALSIEELRERTALARTTLQTALGELQKECSVKRIGSGKKGDSHRYRRNAAETPSA
jgi:AAA domain